MQESIGLLAEQSGDDLCKGPQNPRNKIASKSPKQVPFGINHRYTSYKNYDFFDKQKKLIDNRQTPIQTRICSSLISCARLNPDKEGWKQQIKRNSWNNQDISEKIKEENGMLSQPLPLSHLPRTKMQLELLNEMRMEDEESLIELDIPQRREDFEGYETEEREFRALEDDIIQNEKDKKQVKRPSGSNNSTASVWALLTLQKDYESSSKARQQVNHLPPNKVELQDQNCCTQQSKFTEQEQIPIKKGTNSIATLFQRQTIIQKPVSETNKLPINGDKIQQHQQQLSLAENQLQHQISSSTDQSSQQEQTSQQLFPKEVKLSYSSNLTKNKFENSAEMPALQIEQEHQTKACLPNQNINKPQEQVLETTKQNIDNKPALNIAQLPQHTNLIQPQESIITPESSETDNFKTCRAVDKPVSESKTYFNQNTISPKQVDAKKNQEQLVQLQLPANITITPIKTNVKQHYSTSLVNSDKSKSTNSSQNLHSKPIRTNSHHASLQQQLCFNQSTQKKSNDHSNFHSIHSVPTSVSHSDTNCFDESREIPLCMVEEQNKKEQRLVEETKERQSSRDKSVRSNRTSQKQKQAHHEISNSFNYINEKTKILNKMSGSYSYNSKEKTSNYEKKYQIVSSSLQKRKITLNIDAKDSAKLRSSDSSKNRSEDKKRIDEIKTNKSPIGKERKQINTYKLNLEEQEINRDKSATKNKKNQVVASRNITLRTSNLSQSRKREENKKEDDIIRPSLNSTFNFKPQYFTPIPHEDITKFLRKSDCTAQETY